MRLPNQPRLNPTGQPQVDSALNTLWQEITRTINGLLSFGSASGGPDNIAGSWFSGVTPGSANVEFAVVHNLGRIPEGWLTISIDQAAIVYKGTTAWTTTTMYLKCNVSSATIKLFVL